MAPCRHLLAFQLLRGQARLHRAVSHHRPAHPQEARDRTPLVQVSFRVELLEAERQQGNKKRGGYVPGEQPRGGRGGGGRGGFGYILGVKSSR